MALGSIMAAVILAAPTSAAACKKPPPKEHPPVQCPETWNPAQQPEKFTGVPGGWSTAPGTTNRSTPQNPDGFFVLQGDEDGLTLRDGCPGFGGLPGNGTGELFQYPGDGNVWPSGTTIKYTEANGVTDPKVKPMAGNNGNGNGNATYIDFHIWGSGDLWICDAEDSDNCACCYVPPPPFTCEGQPSSIPCPEPE